MGLWVCIKSSQIIFKDRLDRHLHDLTRGCRYRCKYIGLVNDCKLNFVTGEKWQTKSSPQAIVYILSPCLGSKYFNCIKLLLKHSSYVTFIPHKTFASLVLKYFLFAFMQKQIICTVYVTCTLRAVLHKLFLLFLVSFNLT